MNLGERQRLAILLLMLVAALVVTAVSSGDDGNDSIVLSVARQSISPGEPRGAGDQPIKTVTLDLAALTREPREDIAVDIFAPKSWYVPPPPPPPSSAAPTPAAPVAPPLPFKYVGQLEDMRGKVIVYLAKAETVYTVSVGDVVDGEYRLESMDERQLTLIYIPLKARQVLPVPPR